MVELLSDKMADMKTFWSSNHMSHSNMTVQTGDGNGQIVKF